MKYLQELSEKDIVKLKANGFMDDDKMAYFGEMQDRSGGTGKYVVEFYNSDIQYEAWKCLFGGKI